MFVISLLGGSALMDEDQKIDLEGTINGNSRSANINEVDLSISNKLVRHCCPMCTRHQTTTNGEKTGVQLAQFSFKK